MQCESIRMSCTRGARFLVCAICLSLFAGLGGEALAQDTHPFSVRDMLAMDRISDPQVSPDGRHVAFVVRQTDLEANRGRTDLWLVATDGGGLRRLTIAPGRRFESPLVAGRAEPLVPVEPLGPRSGGPLASPGLEDSPSMAARRSR